MLMVWGLNLRNSKVMANITQKKQISSQELQKLFEEQEQVDGQIDVLSNKIDSMDSVLSLRNNVFWSEILDDIRWATPKSIQITDMSSNANMEMALRGAALSYEGVNLFVDMLNKSEYIESATLVKTENDRDDSRLLNYSINCQLKVTSK